MGGAERTFGSIAPSDWTNLTLGTLAVSWGGGNWVGWGGKCGGDYSGHLRGDMPSSVTDCRVEPTGILIHAPPILEVFVQKLGLAVLSGSGQGP